MTRAAILSKINLLVVELRDHVTQRNWAAVRLAASQLERLESRLAAMTHVGHKG